LSKDTYDIILERRSIRSFKQKEIDFEILKKCVNVARLAPSAANLQPLEFIIVNEKKTCSKLFKALGFAGYLKDWDPVESESPTAYIVILCNDQSNKWYERDASFAAENIALTAESKNIGSCVLCNIDKEKIRDILKIPEKIIIDSVVALGYKNEKSVIEDYTNSVKYYKDKDNVLHVPKKKLESVMHINKF
jgi:nitroreductase